MEQEQAFRGEMLYTGMLEGALVDPDYSVRVDNVRWSQPGEATILSDQFFLEWLMYREDDIECARPGRNFVTSHAVILLPPGQAVRTRWNSGRLRTISCSFRTELLADYPELLSFLSSLDGPFLQAGLTRIADEVVTPGLDSGFMVRSLLFAICGEIRRATLGQPVPQECDGALSPGQMTMLRQVLHESGKLPTVVDLAQHCGVTSRALSPLVKRATGVTPEPREGAARRPEIDGQASRLFLRLCQRSGVYGRLSQDDGHDAGRVSDAVLIGSFSRLKVTHNADCASPQRFPRSEDDMAARRTRPAL